MKKILELIRKHLPKPFKQWVRKHILEPRHQFILHHIPFDIAVKIKSFVRPEYKKENIKQNQAAYSWVQEIEKNKKHDKKIRVVFLCQYYTAWNACMPAFQAALADPDIEVYLLAVPQKVWKAAPDKIHSQISHEIYAENLAYSFCQNFFPKTIDTYDPKTEQWFDIKALSPDYIFVQRPYQMHLPPQYRCNELASYTKVCYIPYAYCKQIWDSRYVYRHSMINYAYAVFTENQMYCDIVRNIYCKTFGAVWKKIEYLGYPRFDMHKNSDIRERPKTVLWLPRWSTLSDVEITTFFKYKDIIINYFMVHPNLKLICRPHPKMFGHFAAVGAMSKAEIDEFKKMFTETENFLLDESGDYLTAFDEADVFISDTSSLLVEEFSTGKPIIFCGTMSRFDRAAKEWAKMMYAVKDEQELMAKLTTLLDGQDPNQEKRAEYAKKCMKHDGQCGQRIIEFLKNDYHNTSSTKG